VPSSNPKLCLKSSKAKKEINVITSENEIAPNQIRNWKNEFIANAWYGGIAAINIWKNMVH
jgi:hypothetical protein